jgi:hypothetical protein
LIEQRFAFLSLNFWRFFIFRELVTFFLELSYYLGQLGKRPVGKIISSWFGVD